MNILCPRASAAKSSIGMRRTTGIVTGNMPLHQTSDGVDRLSSAAQKKKDRQTGLAAHVKLKILLSFRWRRFARLGWKLSVTVLRPPRRMVRLGIRNRYIVGRAECRLRRAGEREAVSLGVNRLLVEATRGRIGNYVDRESSAARREHGGYIVGYHETILRIRQVTEQHLWRGLPSSSPGCAAIARLRIARIQVAGISAIRDGVVVIGDRHMGRASRGLGVDAQAVNEVVHTAAYRINRNADD